VATIRLAAPFRIKLIDVREPAELETVLACELQNSLDSV